MSNPKKQIKLQLFDLIVEIVGIVILLLSVLYTIKYYAKLPTLIPTHFDIAGQPDDFGSKNTLLAFPIILIVIFTGLTVLNFFPHIFNIPVKLNEKNIERLYRIATRGIRILKIEIVFLFAYINYKTIAISIGKSDGLGSLYLFALIFLLFFSLIIMIIQIYRNK